MASISIYTTGGEFVEGNPINANRNESLIEELGVIPPWQAIYLDPDEDLLIHIFTAKRRETGSATRKANNYYCVTEGSDESVEALWTRIREFFETQLGSNESPWEIAPENSIKSDLSSPTHIQTTAKMHPEPQTLPQLGIEYWLREYNESLRFGFGSARTLQKTVRTYEHCGTPILSATKLNSDELVESGLQCQLGGERDFQPLDPDTVEYLESSIADVGTARRLTHLNSIEEIFVEIEKQILNGTLQPDETISTLVQIKKGNTKIESVPKSIQNLLEVIENRREQIAIEADVEPVGDVGNIQQLVADHPTQFKSELRELTEKAIIEIRTSVIENAADQFEERIESEITDVGMNINLEPHEIESLIAKQFLTDHSTGGVKTDLKDLFNLRSSNDTPPSLRTKIDQLEAEAEKTVIPDLAETTGLAEAEVKSMFRNSVTVDIESTSSNTLDRT